LSSREQLLRWLPVVGWAALISVFSTGAFAFERTGAVMLPVLTFLFPWAGAEELRAIHATTRKLAHFTEYLVLSVLLYRALAVGRGWDVRAAAMAVVIAGVYSLGDELHQWFVPGRTAALTDCLIDFSGAAAGQGLLAAFSRGRRVVSPSSARAS